MRTRNIFERIQLNTPDLAREKSRDLPVNFDNLNHGVIVPNIVQATYSLLEPPPPDDWAQTAADAVLADLMDRRSVGRELSATETHDPFTWGEIRATVARIIRDTARTEKQRT